MDFSSVVRQIKNVYHWLIPPARSYSVFPALTRLIQAYNSHSKPPQILYLGDSVVERVSREDNDQRTLGQMLLDVLAPRYSGMYISHSSYHPTVFYYLLRTLEKMRHKPELVILPVNMRCFSPQWHLKPKWQFEQEISILKQYLENPGILKQGAIKRNSGNEISDFQMDEFMNTPVDYPLTDFNRIGDFEEIINTTPNTEVEINFRKRQIFIFHYLYPLSRDHPKIIMLENVLNYLKSIDIRVFVYITPINFQAGERFVGPVFRQYLDANLQVVADLLKPYTISSGAIFEDWCTRFASTCFFNKDLATEHLNQLGRLELASLIRDTLFEKWK